MRQTQMLWLFLMVCLFAGLAHGNSLPGDPQVEIDDPSCAPTLTQNISAGQIENFSTTSAGTGCFGFNIVSGTFNSIEIQIGAFIDPATITCFSPDYGCSKSNLDDGTVTDLLFTALLIPSECFESCHPSGPYTAGGPTFVVDLRGDSFGNWGAQTFYIRGDNSTTPTDNPNLIQLFNAPEPSSFALLGTGAAAIAARRKLLKNKNA